MIKIVTSTVVFYIKPTRLPPIFAGMSYKRISATDIEQLERIVGAEYVCTDAASIEKFSRDETDGVSFPPEVVV